MNTEQCITMMKNLCDVYRRATESSNIHSNEIYKLKHTLTELELSMGAMRKHMDKIYKVSLERKRTKEKK